MIGKRIGQYQVIDKIGEGGMGAVYKAEDTTLHRLVALKTLSGHLTEDEEAQERFIREAQSASSLNHPNITTVHEFIEDGDTRLICMEYVEGKTIRDMVESGIVSVGKAIDIITQAAEALEAAHNKGILHRDVKSANIMVNMEGRVKVMDFGLAHLESRSQLTRTGTTLGTLSYSCPEQLTGRTVDRRSEVWSLGVVFYELLTGRIPFKGPSEGELVFAIINNMPEKVSKLRDDVPELVEAVVAKMLDKDPDLRYQNMGEVISDLSGIRKGLETSTVSLSEGLGQTKAVRRLGIVARIGIGVAVMAVLAVGAALLFLQRPGLDPNRVVLSLIENRTGDSQLDQFGEIIAHNIYSAIQPSQLIDLVPFNISAPFLERDEFLNSLHPNRTLAEFTGAGIVVAGAFYLVDDTTLECQVDIIDARSDRLLASIQPVRGPRENQTDLIKEVQQQVSIVLAMRLDPLLPDYVVSFPDNLDAYRAFLEGLKEINRSRWSAAVPHFMRALEADPNYSSAQINLAIACINFGDRTVRMFADSIVTVVEAKRDQLPIIEATMTDWLRAMIDGNREAGYRAALEASEHTSVGSSGYFIGQEAMKTNRLKVAISAFEEVDPSIPYFQEWVPYWRRLIDSYNMAGKPKQALKAVYRGLEMHPENRVLRGRLVNTLSLLGRTAEVQQILEAEFPLPGGGDYWYGAARRLRAYSYLEEAQSIGERMISWFDNLSAEEQSGRAARVIVADGHYYADQLDDAERLYRSLNQETPANHNMILGVLAAMRGDREVARQWSNRIEENAKPAGKYNYGRAQFYQACIAAHVGDRDRAVELLREAYQRGRSYSGMYFWPQLEPLRGHPGYEEFMRPKG